MKVVFILREHFYYIIDTNAFKLIIENQSLN